LRQWALAKDNFAGLYLILVYTQGGSVLQAQVIAAPRFKDADIRITFTIDDDAIPEKGTRKQTEYWNTPPKLFHSYIPPGASFRKADQGTSLG
jgi:hypothetical protein